MGTHKRQVITAVVMVAGLLVGGATLAWACTAQATIQLSPRWGEPGSTVVVDGRSFVDGGPVSIRWDSPSGPQLATATGPSFSTAVTVPDVDAGVYYVVAVGYETDGETVAGQTSAAFEVTGSGGDDGSEGSSSTSQDQGSQTSVSPSGGSDSEGTDGSGTTTVTTSGDSGGDSGDAPNDSSPAASSEDQASTTQTGDASTGDASTGDSTQREQAASGAASEPPAPTSDAPSEQEAGQSTAGDAGDPASGTAGSTAASRTGAQAPADQAAAPEGTAGGTTSPDARIRDPRLAAPADDLSSDSARDVGAEAPARSGVEDLWSGFAAGETGSLVPDLTDAPGAPERASSPLAVAGLLLGGGLLALFGAFGTALVRRRRAVSGSR